MGDASKNFDMSEFKCPCCGKNGISPKIIAVAQRIRDFVNVPLKISSGYRCEKHNQEVGGAPYSAHVGGWAIDIRCEDPFIRYKILKAAINDDDVMGIEWGTPTWIHVDVNPKRSGKIIFNK